MQSHVISEVDSKPEKVVNREKVCPFLLRIFVVSVRHNPIQEYKNGNAPRNELQIYTCVRHNPIQEYKNGNAPRNELQIYTWMDCTLRELMMLIRDVNAESRPRGTSFDFSIVSPERFSSRMNIRPIGITINGSRNVDDTKTLADCKFEIGDFIDVAITPPRIPSRDFPRRSIEGPPGRRFDRDRRRF
uniref:Histone deacetylase complex subunit SAP18 n=1 Tax=Panagrolaimus sp. JU765 TaxID=591449 RepID=A0AC34R9F8_9BILA